MLTATEIEQHIANVRHETRGIEFKGAGSTNDRHYFAKIVRAALSMANLRDGGYVVLGVNDANGNLAVNGLSTDEVSEWTNFDNISDGLAVYADPPLSFELAPVTLTDGKQLVVIQLHPFTDLPHLCAKAYSDGKKEVLRKGALYVRNRKKPETSEVASHVEMREVLSIATQNALRDFVATAQYAGLQLQTSDPSAAYDQESAEWTTESAYTSRQLAHWDIVIRPQPYEAERLDRDKLESVIVQSAVRLRGWPVPYIDSAETLNGQSSLSCDITKENSAHVEQWRFFTSGQFLHRRVLSADLIGKTDRVPSWEVLSYLTEIVELAARLSQSMAIPERITIRANLCGVAGRYLVSDEHKFDLGNDYRTSDSILTASIDVPVSGLLSEARPLARGMAKAILHGFGFVVSDEVLDFHQQKLTS